jgi:hypothetical protein
MAYYFNGVKCDTLAELTALQKLLAKKPSAKPKASTGTTQCKRCASNELLLRFAKRLGDRYEADR